MDREAEDHDDEKIDRSLLHWSVETVRHWTAWRQAVRLLEVGWVPLGGENRNISASDQRRAVTPSTIRMQSTKSINRVAPMTNEEKMAAESWKNHLFHDSSNVHLRPESSSIRDAYLRIEGAKREKINKTGEGDNKTHLRPISSSGNIA